jgi:hypothetical protein
VQRVWDQHGLKPHLVKYPRPRRGAGSLREIVGLYLNPPDRVLALCLGRVPRRLAGKRAGHFESQADDKPGSSTLTALGNLEATVIGDSQRRARQQAFLGFLRRVERAIPPGLPMHLIVDDEGSHTQYQAWLKRRPNLHLHPAPVGSNWSGWVAAWWRELGPVSIVAANRRSLFVS